MRHFPKTSLDFEEAYVIGTQLWDFGKVLKNTPGYQKPDNWILTYRYPIRAMMGRILNVGREYESLNTLRVGLAPAEEMQTQYDRNVWNVIWESYAGSLFFAMDSSLECFTYSLNALGYLLNPCDFLDITTNEKLRWITPS